MRTGLHWAASLRRDPRYVHVPYWPHRVLVIGWGRLGRDGTFHDRQPCCYRMRLLYCCPGAPAWGTAPPPGTSSPWDDPGHDILGDIRAIGDRPSGLS